jgi:carbonic anhydrase
VQDVERSHEQKLSGIQDADERLNKLCELNVSEQVQNIARTTIVQDAWRRGHDVKLHGWIYGLKDGLISDLGIQISDLGIQISKESEK